MAKFIEVHCGADSRLVNTHHVYMVSPGFGNCGAFIYFAYQERDSWEGEYIQTEESYEEVKRMIMEDV